MGRSLFKERRRHLCCWPASGGGGPGVLHYRLLGLFVLKHAKKKKSKAPTVDHLARASMKSAARREKKRELQDTLNVDTSNAYGGQDLGPGHVCLRVAYN